MKKSVQNSPTNAQSELKVGTGVEIGVIEHRQCDRTLSQGKLENLGSRSLMELQPLNGKSKLPCPAPQSQQHTAVDFAAAASSTQQQPSKSRGSATRVPAEQASATMGILNNKASASPSSFIPHGQQAAASLTSTSANTNGRPAVQPSATAEGTALTCDMRGPPTPQQQQHPSARSLRINESSPADSHTDGISQSSKKRTTDQPSLSSKPPLTKPKEAAPRPKNLQITTWTTNPKNPQNCAETPSPMTLSLELYSLSNDSKRTKFDIGKTSTSKGLSKSMLNLQALDCRKLLSECNQSLEFIIVAFCRAFNFSKPALAAKFMAGGLNSQYAASLEEISNFTKINQFLSLLQTNLKTLIHILESENDHQNVRLGQTGMMAHENSSQSKIMSLLAMGLSKSVDERVVWQTCNLLSAIFQNINGIQINYGFQALMIRWAMNQDSRGAFLCPSLDLQGGRQHQKVDFIQSCLLARQNHHELNTVVISLFYEVANMGRSKRKRERQNDNSQLVELFAVILPQYFHAEKQDEYFDLMHDVLESHNFQFEKERIDKQHLLFKMVDKCLHCLSIINNIADPKSPDNPEDQFKLRNSVNIRQSCMTLICSIWSNNPQIFQLSLNKFIAHFVQLFKPEDKQVTKSLNFDYIEYQQQTKVGKIVLLLLKRNLKDANKLIKMTSLSQLFKLLQQFTLSKEVELESVVFKLMVFQLIDLLKSQSQMDSIEVRVVLSNYLSEYIGQNGEANVEFLVDMIAKYGESQLLKMMKKEGDGMFPMFNTCDYGLLIQIIRHPNMTEAAAVNLYNLFSQALMAENFNDYCSLTVCMKCLVALSTTYGVELLQNWKKLIQLSCITITKLDLQILQLQQAMQAQEKKDEVKDIQRPPQQPESMIFKNRLQASEMILKRHVIFRAVLNIVQKSNNNSTEISGLKLFTNEFLSKFAEKATSSKTINVLVQQLKSPEAPVACRVNVELMIVPPSKQRKSKNLVHEYEASQHCKSAASLSKGLKLPPIAWSFGQELGAKPSETLRCSRRKQPRIEINMFSQLALNSASQRRLGAHQETYRTGGVAGKSIHRRRISYQADLQDDLLDQSSQTTLRTEIYTSEEEEELVNYYTYLSTYKRHNLDARTQSRTENIAESSIQQRNKQLNVDEDAEEYNGEQEIEQMIYQNGSEANILGQGIEGSPELQLSTQTKHSHVSNPLAKGESQLKLADEVSNHLARTKEQLCKPDEPDRKNDRQRKAKQARLTHLLRRQPSQYLEDNVEGQWREESKEEGLSANPTNGQQQINQTDQAMFNHEQSSTAKGPNSDKSPAGDTLRSSDLAHRGAPSQAVAPTSPAQEVDSKENDKKARHVEEESEKLKKKSIANQQSVAEVDAMQEESPDKQKREPPDVQPMAEDKQADQKSSYTVAIAERDFHLQLKTAADGPWRRNDVLGLQQVDGTLSQGGTGEPLNPRRDSMNQDIGQTHECESNLPALVPATEQLPADKGTERSRKPLECPTQGVIDVYGQHQQVEAADAPILADVIEIADQSALDIEKNTEEQIEDGRARAPQPSKEERTCPDSAAEKRLPEPAVQLPRIQLNNGAEPQSHSTRIQSLARKTGESVDDKKVTSQREAIYVSQIYQSQALKTVAADSFNDRCDSSNATPNTPSGTTLPQDSPHQQIGGVGRDKDDEQPSQARQELKISIIESQKGQQSKENNADSTPQMVNKQIQKLFGTDEKSEQLKHRSIYKEQLKSLGFVSQQSKIRIDVNSKLSSRELSEPMADSNSNSDKNVKHLVEHQAQNQSQMGLDRAPAQRHPQTPSNSRPVPITPQESYTKTMPAQQAASQAQRAAFHQEDQGHQQLQPPHDPVAYENFVTQVRQLYQLQLALQAQLHQLQMSKQQSRQPLVFQQQTPPYGGSNAVGYMPEYNYFGGNVPKARFPESVPYGMAPGNFNFQGQVGFQPPNAQGAYFSVPNDNGMGQPLQERHSYRAGVPPQPGMASNQSMNRRLEQHAQADAARKRRAFASRGHSVSAQSGFSNTSNAFVGQHYNSQTISFPGQLPPMRRDGLEMLPGTSAEPFSRQANKSAMKMRKQAREEFTATIKSIRLNQDQIDTMSQKVSERIQQSKEYKRKKFQMRAISMPNADQDSEALSISGTMYNQDHGPLVPKPSTRHRRKSELAPLTPSKVPMMDMVDPVQAYYPYHASQTPKPAHSRPLDMSAGAPREVNFGNLAASAMQEMQRLPPADEAPSQLWQAIAQPQ